MFCSAPVSATHLPDILFSFLIFFLPSFPSVVFFFLLIFLQVVPASTHIRRLQVFFALPLSTLSRNKWNPPFLGSVHAVTCYIYRSGSTTVHPVTFVNICTEMPVPEVKIFSVDTSIVNQLKNLTNLYVENVLQSHRSILGYISYQRAIFHRWLQAAIRK